MSNLDLASWLALSSTTQTLTLELSRPLATLERRRVDWRCEGRSPKRFSRKFRKR